MGLSAKVAKQFCRGVCHEKSNGGSAYCQNGPEITCSLGVGAERAYYLGLHLVKPVPPRFLTSPKKEIAEFTDGPGCAATQ